MIPKVGHLYCIYMLQFPIQCLSFCCLIYHVIRGRLNFFVFFIYLFRAIKKMKNNSESSLLSAIRSSRGEKILEIDGTVTTQPVLEHVGISTWPGECVKT